MRRELRGRWVETRNKAAQEMRVSTLFLSAPCGGISVPRDCVFKGVGGGGLLVGSFWRRQRKQFKQTLKFCVRQVLPI